MPQGNGGLFRRWTELWCYVFHSNTMWPLRDSYRCRTCGRIYPVPWANTGWVPANVIPRRANSDPVTIGARLASLFGLRQTQ
jgi:hypothetical protein